MANPDQETPETGRRGEFRRLGADVLEMARLRWDLARLEMAEAYRVSRNLALALAGAAALGLAAIPLFAVAGAESLAGHWRLSRVGWLALFAAIFLTLGALIAAWAWRHFRRVFRGMEQSLEEIQEDVEWIRERLGKQG